MKCSDKHRKQKHINLNGEKIISNIDFWMRCLYLLVSVQI